MPHRMLLADDSLTIQKVVELTFSDSGYELMAVGSGDKAVQALETFRPDIVLADVVMPGLSGYEVCEQVKALDGGEFIPVILLTGTFEPFDRSRAERVGCDSIVTKPFDSHALASQVRELLGKAANARSMQEVGSPVVSPFPAPAGEIRPSTSGVTASMPAVLSGWSTAQEPLPSNPFGTDTRPPAESESELLYATTALRIPSAQDFIEMEAKNRTEALAAVPVPPETEAFSPPAAEEPIPFREDEGPSPASTMEFEETLVERPFRYEAAAEHETTIPLPRMGEPITPSPVGGEPPTAESQELIDDAPLEPVDGTPLASLERAPVDQEPLETEPLFPITPAATVYENSTGPIEIPPLEDDSVSALFESDETPAPGAERATEPGLPAADTEPFAGHEPVRRDLDEDIAAFERSGQQTRRASFWDELPPRRIGATELEPLDERALEEAPEPFAKQEAASEPIELEALAAGASLTDLIPPASAGMTQTPHSSSDGSLSEGDVDRIARRVVELLGEKVVREIAWDIVPEMAERFVRARIQELESEPE